MQQEETNPPTPEQIALAADIEAHGQAMLDGHINPYGEDGLWAMSKKKQKLIASCEASGSSESALFPDGGAVDRVGSKWYGPA